LTQIKGDTGRTPKLFRNEAIKARPMFDSGELRDELQALKGELSRLLGEKGDGILDGSRTRAEALADQIKAALNDLGETLSEQEDRVADLVSERPIASLASAFALGVVVGFMLRRQ
jgi:ElaB/YqjD/DUF883 family membrane-anchored ribosome-binding protein